MGVTRDEERTLSASLGPFELRNALIDLAGEHHRHSAALLLDAGRGDPNWTAIPPRQAFFLLGAFGVEESKRDWNEWPAVGGMPAEQGIAERFRAFLEQHGPAPGVDLLKGALGYGVERLGFDADTWIHELTNAIIGDDYPVPPRMLSCVERVVHEYIVKELTGGGSTERAYDLFGTEGGTAAICYVFDSLQANGFLAKGDKIALMTPIFAPYVEIPSLERFSFEVVAIEAGTVDRDGYRTWHYPQAELDKLSDPSIKALVLVNPSNPPSVMLPPEARQRIADIVRTSNPHLAIITDDVYATFVDGFRSLLAELPRNTIGVYSFSKYFGCTGWRLGVIALDRDNIFDEHLTNHARYRSLSPRPESVRFIDRIVADSRDVALRHTAGLSSPQQVQMALFALFSLLDTKDEYRRATRTILARRLNALLAGIGVPLPEDTDRAGYYVELDLRSWAERHWGKGFTTWMRENYEPVDPLFRLAERHSIVLLPGSGFDGPTWSVRISMANLPMEAYEQIGAWLFEIGEEYHAEYIKANQRGGPHIPRQSSGA